MWDTISKIRTVTDTESSTISPELEILGPKLRTESPEHCRWECRWECHCSYYPDAQRTRQMEKEEEKERKICRTVLPSSRLEQVKGQSV